jgi:hypothetical protein
MIIEIALGIVLGVVLLFFLTLTLAFILERPGTSILILFILICMIYSAFQKPLDSFFFALSGHGPH